MRELLFPMDRLKARHATKRLNVAMCLTSFPFGVVSAGLSELSCHEYEGMRVIGEIVCWKSELIMSENAGKSVARTKVN